ncbi:hypothetical protein PO909_023909 [Leuciscus waleckii]
MPRSSCGSCRAPLSDSDRYVICALCLGLAPSASTAPRKRKRRAQRPPEPDTVAERSPEPLPRASLSPSPPHLLTRSGRLSPALPSPQGMKQTTLLS